MTDKTRRGLITGAALAGVAGAATTAFPTPAISQGLKKWTMVTTWPKNFPGLGTGAELLADYITKASGGRLTVEVFGAGQRVPAFEAMDAVSEGTVEMGHGAPYYWKGKVPAAQYIAAVPFGLNAQEMNAWFQYGGGQALADEVYAQMNCKFFPSGNTGVQMGGWFNREMNSLEDYKGLKMRIPGLGGEIAKRAGASVINLPGGELLGAMTSGQIDAMEWVGPYNDLAFGIYKVAKYYYYPGWHEPSTCLDNFINLDAWNGLDDDLKAIVDHANKAVNQMVLSEFQARNNQSLQTLVGQHNVDLRPFPDDLLNGLGKIAGEYLQDQVAEDALSKKVFDSMVTFRTGAMNWTKLSELAFADARALPFPYAKP
ncbi:MAG: TRAP transporter substrate-binding protein [Alphaproteobacteria bacterium]